MDGHAPAARDSEARPVRLDPPKLAEQLAVRVAALALSTSARTIQSLPSRMTDLFFLLPYSLSGCATRFAGCALSCLSAIEPLHRNPVPRGVRARQRLRRSRAAVALGCTIKLYHRVKF
jgi:hypothetical protein